MGKRRLTPKRTASPTRISPRPKASSSSHAWVAGPVIGAIVGVTLLILALLYFIRKKRPKVQETEKHEDKAQLDREGVKPKEVEANEITELEGRRVVPLEMDAGYSGERCWLRRAILQGNLFREEEKGVRSFLVYSR